ncbi:MAG: hypothetical protein HEQ23_01840 [Tepidisphaera sp.]
MSTTVGKIVRHEQLAVDEEYISLHAHEACIQGVQERPGVVVVVVRVPARDDRAGEDLG